ncbi:MAG TPA: transcriptional regulator [Pseudonocardiaceae bacterium]
MTDPLAELRSTIVHGDGDNRLVPRIADGSAPREALVALAGEERRIVASDWRSFLTLAARAEDRPTREFFTTLAQGEAVSLDNVTTFGAAVGLDPAAYRPLAGCQAYPSYVARLAQEAAPADALLAVVANFVAWGGYCATVARALREHYGLDDAACAFFDFFATPAPDLDRQAADAVRAAHAAGRLTGQATEYGRLLQSYELMFWNTIADAC